MSAKQDRVSPRTPTDIERKYNFGKSFAEVMGFAQDAEKAAEEAKSAAADASNAVGDLDSKLDQTEIFNRLTNNGEAQGIYRAEDGQIYINASYLASGIIQSADGTVVIDLGNNKVTIGTLISGRTGKIELDASGIYGYGLDATSGEYYKTLRIDPGGKSSSGVEALTMITSADSTAGLDICCQKTAGITSIGHPYGDTRICGATISILNKTVSWQDNGDGTYTLIGT